jgi:uncharacterized FAD-dependent dehydrogenase
LWGNLEKVVIVGAGPAGLFAANELINHAYDVKVVDAMSKVGGQGLNIDGKFNYHPKIGGDLTEFLPDEDKAWEVIRKIEGIFDKYCDGKAEVYYNEEKLEELKQRAIRAKIDFIKIKQKHIGSDLLPFIMTEFKRDLEASGVEFKLRTRAQDIVRNDGMIKEVVTNNGSLDCDYAILAPGRQGYSWLRDQCKNLGLNVIFNPLDVGVRVEVRNELFKEIVEDYKCHDPKFHIFTPSYDDFVRTFCVCYSGLVTKEKYGDLYGVNGHSHSKHGTLSNNTNFAFLVRRKLTEPVSDTTEVGEKLMELGNAWGGKSPIIQRLGDIKRHRRSTWDRINHSYVKPTLKEGVTPGDIMSALDYRTSQDILEGLEMLDNVIPGVFADSTLFYFPEIKYYSRRVHTNGLLQTKIPNLYVAGDGAGVSRGIVGAAATGIIAARGIKQLHN